MTKDQNIPPCPLCGSPAILVKDVEGEELYNVRCTGFVCPASWPDPWDWAGTPEEAIENWTIAYWPDS